MARRRRRRSGLAGTVQEHRKQARGLVPDVRSWVKDFRATLSHRGGVTIKRCHEALDLLVGAARVQARYDQERAWGARGRTGRRGTAGVIRKLRGKFYNACVAPNRRIVG